MVKYQNVAHCDIIIIINGKLQVVKSKEIIEAKNIVYHPGLEELYIPRKMVKKKDASKATTKTIRK